jgi:uncharacterized membrane protein
MRRGPAVGAGEYHQVAGRSLERLAALSDGIFAVAMTILVFNLAVPAADAARAVHRQSPLWTSGATGQEHVVWTVLGVMAPKLLACLLGFLTLGMFWLGQQAQLDQLERADRNLVWIHVFFLFGISMVPFAISLIAAFTASRLALLVYWLVLLFLGVIQLAGLGYVRRAGVIKPDAPDGALAAIRRRILVVQALYAVSVAFGVIDTYISIALIILLQLNSAVAPRFGLMHRL